MNDRVLVLKLNPQGKEMWRYEGDVLERTADSLTLEALFDRDDRPFMDTTLKRGDRFVETYYSTRWYNIYAIYDRDDSSLKGWYCNITKPAVWSDGHVEYVDLFLDLWVSTDGTQTVLDEDEFAAADLSDDLMQSARQGLAELQAWFKSKRPPR
jgi:uncharacterized protein